MKKVLVFGGGGHGKVVIDILEKQRSYKVLGLLDHNVPRGSTHYGYEVLGADKELAQLAAEACGIVVAIGDSVTREKVAAQISEIAPNLEFISAIHPDTQIARGVEIGAGTVVMAGAVINSDTKIGQHCIIDTAASIDHDNQIEGFACILPGAVLGGNVRVGRYSAVCLGASVIHNISIGEHSVVGAGAVVLEDIPAYSVAYGVPARVVRARKAGERYL